MVVLTAFVYLALPVLTSAAPGALAGYRLMHLGAVRGVPVGFGMGSIAIAADFGYGRAIAL